MPRKEISINANEQKVEAVNVGNELHAIHKQLGCDMIQCIDLGGNHTLICDEEGRLKEQAWGFKLAGPTVIAGNALIVGTTEDGDSADNQAPLSLNSSTLPGKISERRTPPSVITTDNNPQPSHQNEVSRKKLSMKRNPGGNLTNSGIKDVS